MAPITQLGLAFLATASLAAAQPGHRRRHQHKRQDGYYGYDSASPLSSTAAAASGTSSASTTAAPSAPFGYGNGTNPYGPTAGTGTGTGYLPSTTPRKTRTRTETRVSTLYLTVNAPGSGAAQPTCGNTVTVTVTDQVTVTAGQSSAASTTPAAVSTTPAAVSTTAAPAGQSNTPDSYGTTSAPVNAAANYGTTTPAAQTTSSAAASSSTSASASATASSPASYGGKLGTKRGCLYQADQNGDCAKLGNDNVISWATNWASNANGGAGSCTFIPQFWGNKNVDQWDSDAEAAVNSGVPALLGYNEPDLDSQANLSPSEGASLWAQHMTKYAGRTTIVSPSVTSRQTGDDFPGLNWLSQFKSAGADWDATGVHFYANCANDPASENVYLKKTVDKAYSLFSKPVWVTEFGCSEGASTDQIKAYLAVAVPYLEGESNVHHYAAFKADLLVSGNGPNAAGEVYVSGN